MFGFMVEWVRWNLYKGMILRANKPDDVQFYDCSEAITNTKLKIWKELGIESNLDDQSCFGSGLHDERVDRLEIKYITIEIDSYTENENGKRGM